MPFKLSPDIAKSIESLASDLRAHFNELRADFLNRPADWLDTDEGIAVDGWLDSLDFLISELEAFPHEPVD